MTTTKAMSGAERVLAACKLQPTDATPVWFMRQAGRTFREYRALREKYEILTIAKTPELSMEVTTMPVKQLGVDAAVMFADIMLPLDGMGVPFHIEPEIGPIIPTPIRTAAQVDRLRVVPPEEGTPYVLAAIRLIRKELQEQTALVGFSGSPFTLACYMIEGRPSRSYDQAKGLMFTYPAVWHTLMEKVTETVILYLRGQINAGIQVTQLFDSWVGVLSPAQYEEYVLPYSKRIFADLQKRKIPSIHFGTGNASLLELMTSAGSDVLSLDWRVSLDDAWKRIGYDKGVQGNLDPVLMLAPDTVWQAGARDVLRRANRRPGHIFNLGHGVLPDTESATLARLVDFVHRESRKL